MKLRGLFISLLALFFVLDFRVMYPCQPAQSFKRAAVAAINFNFFRSCQPVKSIITRANVFAYKAYWQFNEYPLVKSFMPTPKKKILEIGRFTIAQKSEFNHMTGEMRPFYTVVYFDGMLPEWRKLFSYFLNIENKDVNFSVGLSSDDLNKVALAILNSYSPDFYALYFPSILSCVTSEADRVFYTQNFIQNKQIKYMKSCQIEKLFELLPLQDRSRLALQVLKINSFSEASFLSLSQIIFLIKQLSVEEDIFYYTKKMIECMLIQYSSSEKIIIIKTVLNIFSTAEQKNKFALYCLKSFSSLKIDDIFALLECVTLSADRAFIVDSIMSDFYSYDLAYPLLKKLLSFISSEEKNTIALINLKKFFDDLSQYGSFLIKFNGRIEIMIKNLTSEADIYYYLEKLIDEQLIIQKADFFFLFDFLKDEHKDIFLSEKLKKAFDCLSSKYLAWMIEMLSSKDLKNEYLQKFIMLQKCKDLSSDELANLCGPFAQSALETSFEVLDEAQVGVLVPYLPEDLKLKWFKKLVTSKQATFLAFYSSTTSAQGPLFSTYSLRNLSQIFDWISDYKVYQGDRSPYLENQENIRYILGRISEFTQREYLKKRIVLFHGQNDQWAFLEILFKRLLLLSHGAITPEKFVWLRFSQKPVLTDKEAAVIQSCGVQGKSGKEFDKYRFKILFTNLHILANQWGSNSLLYTLSNADQSAGRRVYITESIKDQFIELGMAKEYEQLLREEPEVFDRLYSLYRQEVFARGNIGRLIALSLSRPIVQSLCYPTRSGGMVFPLMINKKMTTDVTEIADHFDQVPDRNEYALVLHPFITDPKKAAEGGVVMETFTSPSNQKSLKYTHDFYSELEKVMQRLLKLRYS